MRVVMEVSYCGTNYNGWQEQDGCVTLQAVLQDAIFSLTKEQVKVVASGRTDAGVHAYKQVVHFDTNFEIPVDKFAFALNVLLPDDFKVIKSYTAGDDFHARFDVKQKTYVYKFYTSRVELPLCKNREYQVGFACDEKKMQDVAGLFVRKYDFTPFCKVGKEDKDRVRTIYDCKVKQIEQNHYEIEITGNGFLHNMVRIIAGTIIDIGIGRIDYDYFKKALESNMLTRADTGRTLPPYGLYLKDVKY